MDRQQAKQRLYSVYEKTMGITPSMLERAMRQYAHLWGPFLPQDRSTPIMDVGCGGGQFLLYMKRAGFTQLQGVDVSQDQVAAAHSYGLSQVEQGDALEYLARNESRFGVVSAQNLLEHLTLGELFNLLDSINRALVRGGEIWIIVPNALSPLGPSVRYSDLTHETAYTPVSIQQALAVCGFGDVRFREAGTPVVHGLKSLVRYGLWLGIRSLLYLWRIVEFGELQAPVFSHDMLVVARKL